MTTLKHKGLASIGAILALTLAACSPAGQGTGPATSPAGQAAGAPQAKAGGVFKFGVVTHMSGGGADYGLAFLNGIKLAVEDINAQGGVTVAGAKYTLEPVACDDEDKADKAANCGKKLGAETHVPVIQTPASSAAFPMMGFNEQEKFLLMATSQTPSFTTTGNKLVVRYINNTDVTMGPWVKRVNAFYVQKNLKAKNAAIMEVSTELGKSWAANFTKAWTAQGGTVTGKASYEVAGTDFYAQLSTLLPKNPDVIVLTTVCQPSSIVIKQARELGFKGLFINSGACSGEQLATLLPKDQVENTVVEVGAWGVPDERIANFMATYKKKFNADPQMISGVGYEGVRMLAKALEKAGDVSDAAKIKAAMPAGLNEMKDNMFGMANLNEAGDMDFPMYVGAVESGKVKGYKVD